MKKIKHIVVNVWKKVNVVPLFYTICQNQLEFKSEESWFPNLSEKNVMSTNSLELLTTDFQEVEEYTSIFRQISQPVESLIKFPVIKKILSLVVVCFPFVYPSTRLPFLVLNIFYRSSGNLQISSSFLFWEKTSDQEGNLKTSYNWNNIFLAGLGTSVLGAMIYFILDPNKRFQILTPRHFLLPSLRANYEHLSFDQLLFDKIGFRRNCQEIEYLFDYLYRFQQSYPLLSVISQQETLSEIFQDINFLNSYLLENEVWISKQVFVLKNPVATRCLSVAFNVLPKLYEESCEVTGLTLFCETLKRKSS
jgi:hypothetical protein